MAGIDHTIIFFHNGKEVINPPTKFIIKNHIITYGRDGDVNDVYFNNKHHYSNEFKHYKSSDCYHYEEKYWRTKCRILNKILNSLKFKKLVEERFTLYFKDNDIEIFILISEEYNISYIFSDEESYVILGGYGHRCNCYTHFYGRGYGEKFERKMCKECYRWLCEEEFSSMYENYLGKYVEDENLKIYWKKLFFKPYWDMTESEIKIEFDD